MARRTRFWLNVANKGNISSSSTTIFNILSAVDTHVGVHTEGMTVERVIGTLGYRLAAPSNAAQLVGSGLILSPEFIDTDDYPSLFDGVAQWHWQYCDYLTGVAHDSTTVADQMPYRQIGVDSALVRKIRPGQQFNLVVQNAVGATLDFTYALRVLLIRP